MFRSAADISSSDPESCSGESDNEEVAAPEPNSNHRTRNADKEGLFDVLDQLAEDQEIPAASTLPGSTQDVGALDLDADGHATVMTSALLEFYCLSRAADVLNAQPGSHGQFTRDSPEVKYLGRKMYNYKSQFLSSHGIVADGIDGQEWGSTRQYYRDSLDMLGGTALEGMNLNASTGRPSSRGAINGSAHTLSVSSSSNELVASGNHLESKGAEVHNLGGVWELQKRIPGNGTYRRSLEHRVNLMNMLQLPPTISADPSTPLPLLGNQSAPFSDRSSRYAVEFTEIKALGRGSFGQVYEVRNHVDGQNYAVKKIPLSQRRLEMLQQGGIHHLEHIMKEIRTLARLEHTNVVRYYGAWLEHAHPLSGESTLEESLQVQTQVETLDDDLATEDAESFGIVFEQSHDAVPFEEDSISASPQHKTASMTSQRKQRRRSSRLTTMSNRSKRSSKHSHGDDDDEDVESIARNFSIPSHGLTSTWAETEGDIFTDGLSEDPSRMQLNFRGGSQAPAVVLHIQMSLHPLTLSSYLSPQTCIRNKIDRPSSPRHCFHLLPSLKILLGILSGVEYLHLKGIVHRDLKPANIFLSIRDDGRDLCPKCNAEKGNPRCAYLPRIGDFGLVADISHCTDSSNTNGAVVVQSSPKKIQHVGTEFYCPPTPQAKCAGGNPTDARGHHADNDHYYTIDEKLDVFALGVILFELVYSLKTKMERQMVLFDLTRGGASLPADFKAKIDCGGVVPGEDGNSAADSLSTCIKGMLEPDPKKRWRCGDVRRCLENLVSIVEN
jgi:translation initiation factor 2-alpha kinase 3